MLNIKNNLFVLLNSVAFEGDRCDMCTEAMEQLQDITEELSCAQVKHHMPQRQLFLCLTHSLNVLESKA